MALGSAISKAATHTRVHEINQASLKSEKSILTLYCFWKKNKKQKKNIHSERTKWTWLKKWSREMVMRNPNIVFLLLVYISWWKIKTQSAEVYPHLSLSLPPFFVFHSPNSGQGNWTISTRRPSEIWGKWVPYIPSFFPFTPFSTVNFSF